MSQQTTYRNRAQESTLVAMAVGWLERNVGAIAIVAVLALVWEAYAELVVQNHAYLPSATFTVEQTLENADMVLTGMWVTFTAILIGFTLAVAVGILVGIVIAESWVIRDLSMPMLIFAYSIPHAILAPMFLIWFGTGVRGVGIFAAWLAFFPTFVNTLTGISTIDPDMKKLGDIVGATSWQQLRYIKFWNALPDIISGVKISIQMTIVGVIIAEFLVGGDGLGFLIIRSTQRAQLGLTFGTLIIIALFAVVLFKAVGYATDKINPHQG
ncbi:ABC transporter permease [Natrarchaeobius sp. A-rgal3]|uniref:ABC transporter permease n=1 Tax=Natrarchaeobius versutus TaxID=1679078 RepID=UPI003510BA3D